MTEHLIQGTEEWKQARIGSLGASVIHEVIAKNASGPSASRATRLAALLLERLTGQERDIFVTKSMQQGKDREPEARDLYALLTNKTVVESGIHQHPTILGTHASPDGLVGDDGLIEIKCPEPKEHLETLDLQRIHDKYVVQMLWQMRCTGRQWCDYVSYNPDFPPHMAMWIKRVEYDAKRIEKIETEVIAFLAELNAKVEKWRLPEAEAAE